MQMPVSIYKDPKMRVRAGHRRDLSVYERVHNASLFSLYLPIANEADTNWVRLAAITRIKSFTIHCL